MPAHRIYRELTPEEAALMEEDIAKIEGERPQIDERFRRIRQAAAEDSFSGQLRRAIHGIHRHRMFLPTFLKRADITWDVLEPFLLGEAPLPSDAIDRIAQVLHLDLQVAETAASGARSEDG